MPEAVTTDRDRARFVYDDAFERIDWMRGVVANERNDEPSEVPGMGSPPRRLSSTELATASELHRIDPQLAGLFERGLRLADEIEEPGVRYLVAHVGRELSRAIISTLTGETLIAAEPDVEESEVEDRFRKKIAAALDLPEAHPHVTSWFRSHQTLVSRVHWRKASPSTDKIRESFVELVGLLFGKIAPYFDTQTELDRLLEVAVPSAEDVERLMRCTVRYTQRQYFFTRLAKSGWLRPLAQVHVFRNPPERRKHDDGSWSIQAWPEGEALARLAAAEPEVVVSELSALPKDNENPAIWNVVAAAAVALSPEDASRLVPTLVHGLKNAPPVLFPRAVVGVIEKLAAGGASDAAFSLTDTLLFVKGVERAKPPTDQAKQEDK